MNRDVGVTELIRAALPEWTVPVFEVAASLGDAFVAAGVLLAFVGADAYRCVRRGSARPVSDRAAFVLAVVLGGLALTLVLKAAFGLSRPPASLQAVPREGEGFPSGHTMAATILWTALALWGGRSATRRRLAVAAVAVGVVGLSRLALGVHYLVDVLASVGFGLAYLFLAAALTGRDPARAFAGAALLGALAVATTAGSADGWLAFVGCVGGAAGWWVLARSRVRRLWASALR